MNLKQEYEEEKQKYKDLEALVSKRIAGTAEKLNCPDELLKQQLVILGSYVRILEERLKYE